MRGGVGRGENESLFKLLYRETVTHEPEDRLLINTNFGASSLTAITTTRLLLIYIRLTQRGTRDAGIEQQGPAYWEGRVRLSSCYYIVS